MISVKNFVNTNITVESAVDTFSGYRTTVYFIPLAVNNSLGGDTVATKFNVFESYQDFESGVTIPDGSTIAPAIRASVQAYFNNGGSKLCCVNPSGYDWASFRTDLIAVSQAVNDFYYVCISNTMIGASGTDVYTTGSAGTLGAIISNSSSYCSWGESAKKELAKYRLCLTTNDSEMLKSTDNTTANIVVKYSTLPSGQYLVDAVLLVGAYFSKIDVSQANSIQDYNFTEETLVNGDSVWFEDVTQSEFEKLTRESQTYGNYNFIGKVANKILNLGGDLASSDNISLALDFGASCIERDLDYSLIELLFGKLPLTAEGQSKLIAAINSQLTRYVDNGFLELDATYQGETKTAVYNGKKYTIIRNGDTLPLGYKIFYVPISMINADDRRDKRFPYMFIAFQSVHGARVIQINGSIL